MPRQAAVHRPWSSLPLWLSYGGPGRLKPAEPSNLVEQSSSRSHRPACDALRVQRSFAPIMLPTIALPGGGGLFEADVMRGDEVHERRRGMGDNAVGIFAVSVVDGFHAERPNYLHARAAVW